MSRAYNLTTCFLQKNRFFLPSFGIVLFLMLYLVAAVFYPGGSHHDNCAPRFDLLHNYWCDLLGERAKNGFVNTARPIALLAMVILGVSLSCLWHDLPHLLNFRARFGIMRWSMTASMFVMMFLFTTYHDLVIYIAGSLALIALLQIYYLLFKTHLWTLLAGGLFCLVLMSVNYYIYFTKNHISILPLLQKVTFILVLFWALRLNVAAVRRAKRNYAIKGVL